MYNFSKILLSLFLCSTQLSVAGVTVVSLGGDCTVATMLRLLKIRKAAYPFDWMYAPFDSVCQAFEDDFQRFLDPESLRVGEDKRIVLDFYGLQFVHDFPTIQHGVALTDAELHPWAEIRNDWRQFIDPVRQKYLRRVNRLQRLLRSSHRVILIYAQIINNPALQAINIVTKEKAIKFRDELIKRYPKLDFTFVLLANTAHEPQDWGLERIRNFPILEPQSPDFYGKFHILLQTLGIPYQARSPLVDPSVLFDPACNHFFE